MRFHAKGGVVCEVPRKGEWPVRFHAKREWSVMFHAKGSGL